MSGETTKVMACSTCGVSKTHTAIAINEIDETGRKYTRWECSGCGSHSRSYDDDPRSRFKQEGS